MNMREIFLGAVFLLVFTLPAATPSPASDEPGEKKNKKDTCNAIDQRLSSVSLGDCLEGGLLESGAYSVRGHPLLVKEYPPLERRAPQSRVLVVGGTHGDEYSSISVTFKWMQILDEHHSGLFHWIFVPLLNPDGLFERPATRTNARGVDINRNKPSPLWREVGYTRWQEMTDENPRYYPGPYPVSEPETEFLVHLIRSFRPDAVISLHSPLNLVDYDGPGNPPRSIGSLWLRRLGNFPGTLGNFAGKKMGIPVITVELASSARMPSGGEISSMWRDLVRWLINETPVEPGPGQLQALDQDMQLRKEFFGK